MNAKTYSFHPALPADVNVPATLDFARPFVPQIQNILEAAGPGLRNASEIAVSGQAVAAIVMVAGLEMVSGLPNLTLYTFGQKVERIGALALSDYRHQTVRARRSEIPQGEAYAGFTVIDGSGRGLTDVQSAELAEHLRVKPEDLRIVNANVGQVDFTKPAEGMVEKLLGTGLTVADWASRRVLYLPAGSGLAAVIQATAIHGLSESWPRTIRLSNVGYEDKAFHVAEVVDPQDMRQWGTNLVAKMQADTTAEALEALANSFEGIEGVAASADGSTISFEVKGQKFNLNVSSAMQS